MASYHIHATLLPDGDAPIDLWVRDGRITFRPVQGAAVLAPLPAFVLPGMVDAHAHLAMDMGGGHRPPGPDVIAANVAANLAAGVTAVRDPGSPRAETLEWVQAGGRPGFPVQTAARFLAPEGRYQPIAEWADAASLPAAAAAHARAGAQWVKVVADWPRFDKALGRRVIPANYDEATFRATVEAVHAAGGRVAVHCAGDAAPACVAAGVDSIEHGDALDAALLAEMARKGIAWTPTLAMTEQLAVVATRDDESRRKFANDRYDTYRALLPAAARAGVTILAGTDMLPHGSIAREVEALVRHGLEPRAALASASSGARAFLGFPAFAEGAPADLVLFAADPREDPGVLAKPSCVLLGGVIAGR